jgi:hypothetical protein
VGNVVVERMEGVVCGVELVISERAVDRVIYYSVQKHILVSCGKGKQ